MFTVSQSESSGSRLNPHTSAPPLSLSNTASAHRQENEDTYDLSRGRPVTMGDSVQQWLASNQSRAPELNSVSLPHLSHQQNITSLQQISARNPQLAGVINATENLRRMLYKPPVADDQSSISSSEDEKSVSDDSTRASSLDDDLAHRISEQLEQRRIGNALRAAGYGPAFMPLQPNPHI